jgi:lysophospholipase L1-like esterase
MKKYFILAGFLAILSCQKPKYNSIGQPWEPDYAIDRSESAIVAFEKKDAEKMPPSGGIVFTGSSSFTNWTNVGKDLATLPVINRGFGGSTLPEVIHYADRTIFKYNPKTIVIYCENDMFGGKDKTPEQVRDAYVALTKLIHEKEPQARIYGVSLKPSPLRWDKRVAVEKANTLIHDFIKSDRNHQYIDIWPVMIKNGRPDGSIFLQDSLHMNEEGYRRWTAVLKPILEKSE